MNLSFIDTYDTYMIHIYITMIFFEIISICIYVEYKSKFIHHISEQKFKLSLDNNKIYAIVLFTLF